MDNLQKLVNQINGLDPSKYSETTWDAMQKEIDNTYNNLIKAFLNLRLKSNKDILNGLLKK